VRFIKAEVLRTVIERNTGARNDDTGAEATEVTLNHAHHVAFGVSRCKVNGGAIARITHLRIHRTIHVDKFAAIISVTLREQLLACDNHVRGFGNVFHRVNEGKLHGFDLFVHGLDRVALTEREAF